MCHGKESCTPSKEIYGALSGGPSLLPEVCILSILNLVRKGLQMSPKELLVTGTSHFKLG